MQLADKFIAVFLCPSLLKIDGKPTIQLKQNVDRCRNRFLPPVCCVVVVMVALCNRADHYIFMLWFVVVVLLLSFFFSPNLSSRRLDVYHTSAHGVVLV